MDRAWAHGWGVLAKIAGAVRTALSRRLIGVFSRRMADADAWFGPTTATQASQDSQDSQALAAAFPMLPPNSAFFKLTQEEDKFYAATSTPREAEPVVAQALKRAVTLSQSQGAREPTPAVETTREISATPRVVEAVVEAEKEEVATITKASNESESAGVGPSAAAPTDETSIPVCFACRVRTRAVVGEGGVQEVRKRSSKSRDLAPERLLWHCNGCDKTRGSPALHIDLSFAEPGLAVRPASVNRTSRARARAFVG